MPPRWRSCAAPLAILASILAAACQEDARDIDPFPIRLDLSRGPAVLAVDIGAGPLPAVIDTASPFTVLDPLAGGETEVPAPRRRRVTVTLLGLDDDGQPTIPRARFPDTAAVELHPCAGTGPCALGLPADAVPFRVLIGADLLARSATRFDFPRSELRFFPQTTGTDAQLGDDCHAVIGNAFAGGGTLLVGGTEVSYSGRRPVISACVDGSQPRGEDLVAEQRGSDAFFLVSTGLGVTVLAASAYDRYAAIGDAPPRDSLVPGDLLLASGPTGALFGEIGRLALVGSLPQDDEGQTERGPCRELQLNRLMSVRSCDETGGVSPCPCPDGAEFCRTAAAIDLDGPIQVAVLEDGHPLFQALRDELRPDTPELDGILGTAALAPLRLELDYVGRRMVMRCMTAQGCITRPAVRSGAAQTSIDRCRQAQADAADGGPPEDGGGDGGNGAAVDAAPADFAPTGGAELLDAR